MAEAGGDGFHQHRAEPDYQNLLGGFRGVPAADAGRFQLWDELRVYAGTEVELWLYVRDYLYDSGGTWPVFVI